MCDIRMNRVTHRTAVFGVGCGVSRIRMSFITRVNTSRHTCECIMSHSQRSHVTLVNESCDT